MSLNYSYTEGSQDSNGLLTWSASYAFLRLPHRTSFAIMACLPDGTQLPIHRFAAVAITGDFSHRRYLLQAGLPRGLEALRYPFVEGAAETEYVM